MTKKIKLQDTGERLIPEYHKTGSIWGAVYGEHLVRYEATGQLVKDKVVLDIACGSGYGTKILAQSAAKVIGVDVDADTVQYASQNYGAPNIEFLVGDATKIPVDTGSVDVVVTYETIEHVAEYKAFMAEIKRVLKPDGLAIISTPNDDEFMTGNHFHIHQFKPNEFKDLIKEYFAYQKAYFQGDWICSAIMDEADMKSEWSKSINALYLAPKGAEKSTYFFTLCSNREVTEKVESLVGMSQHWSFRDTQEVEKEQAQLFDKLQKKNAHLETTLARTTNKLTLELDNAKKEIESIKNSKSWRLAQKVSRVNNSVRLHKAPKTNVEK